MKKFNMSLGKKQIGIGLLELMLSLAIIAVLLVMATRYYMSASMNSRINQTVSAILGLPAAAECWSSSGSNTANQGTYAGIDLYAVSYTDKCFPTALVQNTAASKNLVTPYGNMAVTSTSSLVCVELKATPKEELQQIAGKICKNNSSGFTIAGISTSFFYEAIRQSCSLTTTCT